MREKLSLFLVGFLLCSFSVFSQTTIKGIVVDKDTKEPLIGVSVFSEADKKGTATDLDGSFSLKVSSLKSSIVFSYVGYTGQKSNALADMGTVEMKTDAIGLSDVIVTSTIGVDRKTPVAMSSIDAEIIQIKLGTREFPEILKSTPGVYATKQGGGFGDSRLNLRGFESENIAVMVNGVPVNDMEWGGVYWSNWAGLSDVTRLMQVQRGLGASKVSSPSVGGSMNIVTKSIDAQKGGSIYYGMGNDGYNKLSFNVSTGLMKNGWAITLLGGKNWGDGYIQNTQFESYSYFLNVSKLINENHQLSLTAFGAPQWHNQRKDQLLISQWGAMPKGERYQYNAGYGYDETGRMKTFNRNSYHKPQISLNHIWEINKKSSLSTVAYASLGWGGGYSGVGKNRSDAYGSTNGIVNMTYRKNNGKVGEFGTFDFEKLMQENHEGTLEGKGSKLAIQNAINNHISFGLLSTYSTKLTDEVELQGGVDLRYYKGIHKTEIADLLGGGYLMDEQRGTDGKYKDNRDWVDEKLTVGDIVYRNYDGFIMQEGVFGQAEYTKNALSAFVSGSFNVTNYWRVEKFAADNEKSETINKVGFGVKGGANYNLTINHNVFANIGYFSRTPYYSGGVFLSNQKSNAINKNGKNEKVFSAELGYGYRSKYINANVNAYRTAWNDKTMVKTLGDANSEKGALNLEGVNALHMGIEVEIKARPTHGLELTAMASFGNWKWQDKSKGYVYDRDGSPLDIKGYTTNQTDGGEGNPIDEPITPGSTNHAWATVDLQGIHVGNSAQTTIALGANYEVFKGMRIGFDYNFYGRNYAKYTVEIPKFNDIKTFVQPWRIPNANVFDLNFNYKFEVGKLKATLYANIDNIFDAIYISDAKDGGNGKRDDASVYYGFGRTWSTGIKVFF